MEVYESRTFCKEIKCPVQLRHDREWPNATDKHAFRKLACSECMAYKFHKWLQENNFIIIKDNK